MKGEESHADAGVDSLESPPAAGSAADTPASTEADAASPTADSTGATDGEAAQPRAVDEHDASSGDAAEQPKLADNNAPTPAEEHSDAGPDALSVASPAAAAADSMDSGPVADGPAPNTPAVEPAAIVTASAEHAELAASPEPVQANPASADKSADKPAAGAEQIVELSMAASLAEPSKGQKQDHSNKHAVAESTAEDHAAHTGTEAAHVDIRGNGYGKEGKHDKETTVERLTTPTAMRMLKTLQQTQGDKPEWHIASGVVFKSKRLNPEEMTAMVDRLCTPRHAEENMPAKPHAVKLVYEVNKETYVPVKVVTKDENISYMAELYSRCQETRSKTQQKLQEKYLQPLYQPPKSPKKAA
eukprot:GHRR01012670.1.p1 GENE.GHRR01012670.1~~GHRR01012670.1.p1  ORF type:complete len:359 (+),score=169.77 GHRR01012670.1:712-1788(+)